MSEHTDWLPFWQGFCVQQMQLHEGNVLVSLQPADRSQLICGSCSKPCPHVHEQIHRRVRDLPILGHPVILDLLLLRVDCPECGHCLQQVSWLDRHARLTQRLAHATAECCARMPVAHVAKMFGLHWTTVRRLDHQRL